jgi:hypothetical protein
MKGRLVVPNSLLGAVLLVAAGAGGSACSSSDSNTNLEPEGPPAVKEVFVNARVGNGLPFNDPFFQGNDPGSIDGGDLAWGNMRDVGPCNFDDTCPTSRGFPAGYTCNTDLRICVGADGIQTGAGGQSLVQDGIIFDTAGGLPRIEIVFKELLQGTTVERFECACSRIVHVAANGAVSLTAGNCSGHNFTTDGVNCGDCPDNPDTSDNEAGACFDINSDGVPDLPSLIPGLASITCTGTNFSYTSGGVGCSGISAAGVPNARPADTCDGFYDPSGNQILPIDAGYEGIGPRFYLYPLFAASGPFPADSDCELTLSNTITDKDNLALAAPTRPYTWHTEVVSIVATDPEASAADAEMIPSGPAPDAISVSMNTLIDPASVAAGSISVTRTALDTSGNPTGAATPVAGTTAQDGEDGTLLVWTPDAALTDNNLYTLTVAGGATGLKDTYGKAMPANAVLVFKAVAATVGLRSTKVPFVRK